MTKLESAFAEAAKLPPEEQDVLADWILEELTSEKRWTEAFAGTPGALERLADEALSEHRQRRTQPLKPDSL